MSFATQARTLRQSSTARPNSTVFRKMVTPNWIDSGRQFWYVIQTGPDAKEWVLVHAQDRKIQRFKTESELVQKIGGEFKIQSVNLKQRPERAPRNQGNETWITFNNLSDQRVEIFWVEGTQKTSYGMVEPRSQQRLHTFSGHLWQVIRADKTDAGYVRALPDGCEVRITGIDSRQPNDAGPTPVIKTLNNNLALMITGKADVPLTRSGTKQDAFERGRSWTSPDRKWMVAFREEPAQQHSIVLRTSRPKNQVEPTYETIEYLKPGDKIVKSRPVLINLATATETVLDNTLCDQPWSLTQLGTDPWADGVTWSTDSKHAFFVYNQRGHQLLRICRIDVDSTLIVPILEETAKTFIDYQAKYAAVFDPKTLQIIWMSERSGFNHLYKVDGRKDRTQAPTAITFGKWNVKSIDTLPDNQGVIFVSIVGYYREQNPYYVHTAAIDIGQSKLRVLTSGDGTHKVSRSPDNKYLIDTYSRVDYPPVTELRNVVDGTLMLGLETADADQYKALGIPMVERFTAKGRDEKTPIYGIVIRPSNYDASKSYPVIENIYAGPQDQYVPSAWVDQMGYMQLLADKGFIVVQIDGMGTNWRSKSFHDVCYKNLKDGGFPDRIAWIQALAKKYPSVDTTRVGVYGGSAGGQNAMAALLWHGEFYRAAVADCGCHDNRMDKTWWNELWMGYPVDDSYRLSSNVEFAHLLKGNLMLVVGEVDHNVDPASTLQVIDALIKADKDFDFIIVPGADHGAGDSQYGRRRRTDFFLRHLQGKVKSND